MKITILLIILFILPVELFSQQVDEWEIIFYGKTESSTFIPSQLKFVDSDTYGFIDGMRGFGGLTKAFYLSNNLTKSVDKKLEFSYSDSVRIIIQDWNYTNNRTIYLLIDSAKFDHYDGINIFYNYKTSILKSVNSGGNWETINLNSNWRSRPSSIIQMSDDSVGMIVQFPSSYDLTEKTDLIWLTNDGWNSSKLINTHPEIIGSQNGIFNEQKKIVLRTLSNLFFISNDLGISWVKRELPIELKLPLDLINQVILYNDSTFFKIAGSKINDELGNRNIVGKTTNRGEKWTIIWDSTKLDDNIFNLSIVNSVKYYGHGNKLRLTTDAGESWDEEPDFYLDGNKTTISNLFEFNNGVKIAQAGYAILRNKGQKTLKSTEFINPDSVYNLPLNFELKWNDVNGADKYHLQIEIRDGVPIDSIRPQAKFDKELVVNDSNIIGNNYLIKNAQPYKEYSCRIRALNGYQSSNWVMKSFTTSKITGIITKEINDTFWLITPNPASDYIEINVPPLERGLGGVAPVRIFDILGVEVTTSNLTPALSKGEGVVRLDISSLSPGVYFVRIGDVVRKFVKM